MKVKVDKDQCIGCGICEGVCPQVFKMNNENIAEVIVDSVNQQDKEAVKEAADSCPVEAIKIEE
ncbi:ferredoxin [Proteinivorax hydrogeniformans]|uniref:Ferredoxin n=1 Tax=Proteinivorax hydrogeniformans TaxID=1826727 RepID=A0AAU8HRJ5_9FIRM